MARGLACADGASMEVDEASRPFVYVATGQSSLVPIALVANPALGSGLPEAVHFHERPEVRCAAADKLDSRKPPPGLIREDSSVPESRNVSVNSIVAGGLPTPVIAPGSFLPAQAAARPTRTAPIRGLRIPPGSSLPDLPTPSAKGPLPWRS